MAWVLGLDFVRAYIALRLDSVWRRQSSAVQGSMERKLISEADPKRSPTWPLRYPSPIRKWAIPYSSSTRK